jgi:hypothetical protein
MSDQERIAKLEAIIKSLVCENLEELGIDCAGYNARDMEGLDASFDMTDYCQVCQAKRDAGL